MITQIPQIGQAQKDFRSFVYLIADFDDHTDSADRASTKKDLRSFFYLIADFDDHADSADRAGTKKDFGSFENLGSLF